MNPIKIRKFENTKISDIDSDSFILIMYDSFGSISKLMNNVDDLEKRIKDSINSYKFKTLQNRFYLPLGHSIYLNYQNKNFLYTPIMWVNQDISNTLNIYNAFICCLTHLLKIKKIKNLECKTLYIVNNPDFKNIEEIQIEKATNDFYNQTLNFDHLLETLDYKENLNINSGYFNLNEQAPIYMNNEFRELSNF